MAGYNQGCRCEDCARAATERHYKKYRTEPPSHGLTGYKTYGCKCRICSDAIREDRKKRLQSLPPSHGLSGYRNYGCRCDTCKKAYRVDRQTKLDSKPHKHGITGYTMHGCRCETCTQSHQKSKLRRTKSITKHNHTGYQYGCRCDVCCEAKRQYTKNNRRQTRADRKRSRKYLLLSKYGITLEQYKKMEANSGGVCQICKRDNGGKSLCVDHCHDTGEVRGLLCNGCNTAIGMARENVATLKNAIEYLKSWEKKKSFTEKQYSSDGRSATSKEYLLF